MKELRFAIFGAHCVAIYNRTGAKAEKFVAQLHSGRLRGQDPTQLLTFYEMTYFKPPMHNSRAAFLRTGGHGGKREGNLKTMRLVHLALESAERNLILPD